jgi:hypothetical protein
MPCLLSLSAANLASPAAPSPTPRHRPRRWLLGHDRARRGRDGAGRHLGRPAAPPGPRGHRPAGLPQLLPGHPGGLEAARHGGAAGAAPATPKEWAYAGAVFNYTGAAASHLAAGKADAGTLVFLLALTGLTAASWALRPSARRDLASPGRLPGRLDRAGRKTVTDHANATRHPRRPPRGGEPTRDAILRAGPT